MPQYTVVGLDDVDYPSVVFITVDEADEHLAALQFLTVSPNGSVLVTNEGSNNAIVNADDAKSLIPLLLFIRSIDLKDRNGLRGKKKQIDRLYELGFFDPNESQISFTALAKGIFIMFDHWLFSEVSANTAAEEVLPEQIEEDSSSETNLLLDAYRQAIGYNDIDADEVDRRVERLRIELGGDDPGARDSAIRECKTVIEASLTKEGALHGALAFLESGALPTPTVTPSATIEDQEFGISIRPVPIESLPSQLVELAKRVQDQSEHPLEELVEWQMSSKVVQKSGIIEDIPSDPPVNPVRRDPFGGASVINITRKVKLL